MKPGRLISKIGGSFYIGTSYLAVYFEFENVKEINDECKTRWEDCKLHNLSDFEV